MWPGNYVPCEGYNLSRNAFNAGALKGDENEARHQNGSSNRHPFWLITKHDPSLYDIQNKLTVDCWTVSLLECLGSAQSCAFTQTDCTCVFS